MARTRSCLVGLVMLAVAGCGDKVVTLYYTPPPPSPKADLHLTVMRVADRRGGEGDRGDPFRVGGIYGGYGNRLSKVMVAQAWPPILMSALVSEFRAVGVDARAGDASPGKPPPDRAWLDGEIRNFSTEARWGREAHVSGSVCLRAPGGGILIEKEFQGVASGYGLNTSTRDSPRIFATRRLPSSSGAWPATRTSRLASSACPRRRRLRHRLRRASEALAGLPAVLGRVVCLDGVDDAAVPVEAADDVDAARDVRDRVLLTRREERGERLPRRRGGRDRSRCRNERAGEREDDLAPGESKRSEGRSEAGERVGR